MVWTRFAVVATTCTTLHGSADVTIDRDPITTTTSDDLRGSAGATIGQRREIGRAHV
mgnify:CR=1 FL=1